MDEHYEVEIEEPEDIDGSNRQLKGEIMQNEHDVLQSLLGQETPEELNNSVTLTRIYLEMKKRQCRCLIKIFQTLREELKTLQTI